MSVGYSGAVLPLYQKSIKAVHLNEINYCKLSIMYIHHLFFANDKLKKILASGKFIFCSIWKYKQLHFLTLTRNTLYKVYSLIEKQEGKHIGTNVMTDFNSFRLIGDLDGSSQIS